MGSSSIVGGMPIPQHTLFIIGIMIVLTNCAQIVILCVKLHMTVNPILRDELEAESVFCYNPPPPRKNSNTWAGEVTEGKKNTTYFLLHKKELFGWETVEGKQLGRKMSTSAPYVLQA